MTPREKRVADLKAARERIDNELGRLMGPTMPPLPEHPPVTYMTVDRASEFARHLVQQVGFTHAQVAKELDISPASVPALIAGRWAS